MRVLVALTVGLCAFTGAADALTGQAVAMRDGPLSSGRFVGPIWMMQCPPNQRLVGLRVHEDSRMASIEAICTKLTMTMGDIVWSASPKLVKQPKVRRSDQPVAYVADKGVERDPYYYGDERNFHDGDADRIVITATDPWENGPDVWERPDYGYQYGDALSGGMDASIQPASYTSYDDASASAFDGPRQPPSEENPYELKYARNTWEATPYVWRYDGQRYRGAVAFQKVKGSYDIVCPSDRFVVGLRAGWRQAKGRDQIAALQLVCSDGNPRTRELVGEWPKSKPVTKGRKSKPVPGLRVERLECSAASANPHDGQAVQSVFGGIEAGRLQTVGISCSRELDADPVITRYGTRFTKWASRHLTALLPPEKEAPRKARKKSGRR